MEITSGCVTAFSASIKRFSAPIGILFQSNWEYSVRLLRNARYRTPTLNICLRSNQEAIESKSSRNNFTPGFSRFRRIVFEVLEPVQSVRWWTSFGENWLAVWVRDERQILFDRVPSVDRDGDRHTPELVPHRKPLKHAINQSNKDHCFTYSVDPERVISVVNQSWLIDNHERMSPDYRIDLNRNGDIRKPLSRLTEIFKSG